MGGLEVAGQVVERQNHDVAVIGDVYRDAWACAAAEEIPREPGAADAGRASP